MTLQLFYHPLASYCWKALIGLYESKLPFESHLVDLGKAAQRAELEALWPFAKFPVLRDAATGEVTPESSILLERLALGHPSARWPLPTDAAKALRTRALDRFFDTYVHEPMQKIVGDRLRAAGAHDPVGVAAARSTLTTSYAYLESVLAGREWADGESFSLADCAAYPAPALADPSGERSGRGPGRHWIVQILVGRAGRRGARIGTHPSRSPSLVAVGGEPTTGWSIEKDVYRFRGRPPAADRQGSVRSATRSRKR